MMIVKTAVCAGNGTWLPQVSCGEDGCITELGNQHLGTNIIINMSTEMKVELIMTASSGREQLARNNTI